MAKRWTKLKLTWNKKTRIIVFIGVGIVSALIVGFITYYSIPMKAEPRELRAAQNMMTVRFVDTPGAVVLEPLDGAKKGIVLYSGGRVDPAAYAYKMSQIAQAGVAVVIVKSPLHLAPLDLRSPSDFTKLVGSVSDWYVGGHSVGGVKACQVAAGGTQFKGLVLFGAYCPDNIAGADLSVLSVGGSADKLTTPEDIAARKNAMPATTKYEVIEGLNHAGFGDYGVQGGDGEMAISDTEALQRITQAVTTFVGATQ